MFEAAQSTATAVEWASLTGEAVPVPPCALRLPPPGMPAEVIQAGAGADVLKREGGSDTALLVGLGVHTMTSSEFYSSHVFPNVSTMAKADLELVVLKVHPPKPSTPHLPSRFVWSLSPRVCPGFSTNTHTHARAKLGWRTHHVGGTMQASVSMCVRVYSCYGTSHGLPARTPRSCRQQPAPSLCPANRRVCFCHPWNCSTPRSPSWCRC